MSYSTIIDNFKNMIVSLIGNPFEKTQYDHEINQNTLLNSKLVKEFNKDIFKELYESKQINIKQFTESIKNQLEIGIYTYTPQTSFYHDDPYCLNIQLFNKPNIARNTINILNTISEITNNNKEYIDIVINEFTKNLYHIFVDKTESIKYVEYQQDIIELIKIVAKITNNNIDSIYQILDRYFNINSSSKINITKYDCTFSPEKAVYMICNLDKTRKNCYMHWITRNSNLIMSAPNNVAYLFDKLSSHDRGRIMKDVSYIQYNNLNNEMINIFNTVCNILRPVQTITNVLEHNNVE